MQPAVDSFLYSFLLRYVPRYDTKLYFYVSFSSSFVSQQSILQILNQKVLELNLLSQLQKFRPGARSFLSAA